MSDSRSLLWCALLRAQDELESRGRELINVKSEETKKDTEILRLRKQLAVAGASGSAGGADSGMRYVLEAPL